MARYSCGVAPVLALILLGRMAVGFQGVVLAGSASTLGQLSPAQSYSVDFVSEPSPPKFSDPSKPYFSASPSGIGTHTEIATIPFEIRVSLDRSGYVIGDRVLYELFIKHTGS